MSTTIGERPYLNPYLAGSLLGVVLFAAFFLTGNGLGASGGLFRVVAAAVDVVAPLHVDRTPYLAEAAGGELDPLDNWVVYQILGALLGGFVSGMLGRRVRFEVKRGPRTSIRLRLLTAFLGGAIMGYGARLARGCTSGQALSGGAVLSAGSWAFMFAVFGGGYLLAWFVRRLWI